MSEKYDEYLKNHKDNVYKCFCWLKENLPEIFGKNIIERKELIGMCEHQCCFGHDDSKNNIEEYNAYDEYFYGGNRSYEVVQNFKKAWLHHIHNNPHHWQYWMLINDDLEEGIVALDMPDNYIIEMICDWWSFSWSKGNLREIFDWYEEHKDNMILSDTTKIKINYILNKIEMKLNNKPDVVE